MTSAPTKRGRGATLARIYPALALLLLLTGCGAAAGKAGAQEATPRPVAGGNPRVVLETDAGEIVAEIFADRAPISAENFLRYVRESRYDGGAFYRTVTMTNQAATPVKIEVIQGGITDGSKRLPPIAHETTAKTGVTHEDGTLSMARSRPGSASSEFFITIGAQPALDFGGARNADGEGFAAFGRVVRGMDVVRRIQRMPTDSASSQNLRERVRIRTARIIMP